MDCKCNWVEAILALVIIISSYMAGANWIIIIAALILLLHAVFCKKCAMCEPMPDSKSTKKKKR